MSTALEFQGQVIKTISGYGYTVKTIWENNKFPTETWEKDGFLTEEDANIDMQDSISKIALEMQSSNKPNKRVGWMQTGKTRS